MYIVALRHAKPVTNGYADDDLRPLSDEGKEIQNKLVQLLKNKKVSPTTILTSPLLRAVQTAEIIANAYGMDFDEEPALGDQFDSSILLKKLSGYDPNSTIFLIGHAPTLESFINELAGKRIVPGGLSKSSAAILKCDGKLQFGKAKFIEYFDGQMD